VLGNLSFGFLKPNILDVKLRTTILYDETASFVKMSATSFETGLLTIDRLPDIIFYTFLCFSTLFLTLPLPRILLFIFRNF